MNMLLLLIAAGMGLVVQNLLMVRITESVSTILITLVI
ncbi:MAG: EamA-like transporter family protein, partial [Serratia marcescens]|nr:EamA-like transporter family protein [Serratia marcescens]